MTIHASEDALRQFYSGERHRNRTRADFRFVANTLAHLERALKHAVEYGARGAVVERDPVGFAHLSQDFRLAEQHGVETSRDTKQMVHRIAIAMTIKRTVQLGCRQLVKRRQEQLDSAAAIRSQLARNAIEFTAIASGEHQCLFQNAARTELVGGLTGLLDAECHALAQLDRS